MTGFTGRLFVAEGSDLMQRATCLSSLSEEERSRAAKYSPIPASRFIARRVFLREVLAKELGVNTEAVRIRTSDGGRPLLCHDGDVPFFSQSSSADRTVVALSHDWYVGADVEWLDETIDFIGIAHRWLTPREVARIEKAATVNDARLEFLRTWTAREAVAKLTGEGIARAIDHFEVLVEPLAVLDFTTNASFTAESWVDGEFLTTVAFADPKLLPGVYGIVRT